MESVVMARIVQHQHHAHVHNVTKCPMQVTYAAQVTLRHATQRQVTSHHVTSCHVHVTSRHVVHGVDVVIVTHTLIVGGVAHDDVSCGTRMVLSCLRIGMLISNEMHHRWLISIVKQAVAVHDMTM